MFLVDDIQVVILLTVEFPDTWSILKWLKKPIKCFKIKLVTLDQLRAEYAGKLLAFVFLANHEALTVNGDNSCNGCTYTVYKKCKRGHAITARI